MEHKSIFDFTTLDTYKITRAIKQVFDVDEYKEVRINLTLESFIGEIYIFECVYALNAGNKVSKQKPIKFVVKIVDKWDTSLGIYLEEDVISRKRCYLESEVDNIVLSDIDNLNNLFDNAPVKTKRLY